MIDVKLVEEALGKCSVRLAQKVWYTRQHPWQIGVSQPGMCAVTGLLLGAGIPEWLIARWLSPQAVAFPDQATRLPEEVSFLEWASAPLGLAYGIPRDVTYQIPGLFDTALDPADGVQRVLRLCKESNRMELAGCSANTVERLNALSLFTTKEFAYVCMVPFSVRRLHDENARLRQELFALKNPDSPLATTQTLVGASGATQVPQVPQVPQQGPQGPAKVEPKVEFEITYVEVAEVGPDNILEPEHELVGAA